MSSHLHSPLWHLWRELHTVTHAAHLSCKGRWPHTHQRDTSQFSSSPALQPQPDFAGLYTYRRGPVMQCNKRLNGNFTVSLHSHGLYLHHSSCGHFGADYAYHRSCKNSALKIGFTQKNNQTNKQVIKRAKESSSHHTSPWMLYWHLYSPVLVRALTKSTCFTSRSGLGIYALGHRWPHLPSPPVLGFTPPAQRPNRTFTPFTSASPSNPST